MTAPLTRNWQRNNLVAADLKCAEIGEIVECSVANGIVAAALDDCQRESKSVRPSGPGVVLDKGEPIRYKGMKFGCPPTNGVNVSARGGGVQWRNHLQAQLYQAKGAIHGRKD